MPAYRKIRPVDNLSGYLSKRVIRSRGIGDGSELSKLAARACIPIDELRGELRAHGWEKVQSSNGTMEIWKPK